MKATTLSALMVVFIGSSLISVASANAFLGATPKHWEERMTEEHITEQLLLVEVENNLGQGAASSRMKQLESMIKPIFAALPKNDKGYLGHATVRYALHRLFVQRHGWVIKGLDAAGSHRNTTSSAGLLKEQVPAYVQDLFEKRLAGRGFGLHELTVLAATIEHLVHSEAIKRLGDAFKVHNLFPTSVMSENEADEVLDTYMASYIMAQDLSNMSLDYALKLKAHMPDMYTGWNDTQKFVRAVRQNCTELDSSAAQKATGELDFSLVARAAERMGEQFGTFQDQECLDMKASLIKMEEPGTGRIRLSDFYKPALNGNWQFQESTTYLRQLGALDESDPKMPRVIIANYIIAPTNCIASSNFYSVCCMDECEGFLGHLEQQIAAPEAPPARIAALVSQLSSTSVSAPRKMPQPLLDRLEEVAAHHGGSVPLHGRLFAQWLHHAFPHECPYPHVSGVTNPQTASEWLESSGDDHRASDEEMRMHVENEQLLASKKLTSTEEDVFASLPWSPEEELLVVRPLQQQQVHSSNRLFANTCSLASFVALTSVAYGLVRSSTASAGTAGVEKFLV